MALDKDIENLAEDMAVTFLQEIAGEQISIMDSQNMNASGQSKAMIEVKVVGKAVILYGPDTLLQLERGRKPTKSGGSGVLKDSIRQWIADKGLSNWFPERGIKGIDSMVFLITRAIHEKGTKRWQDRTTSGILSDTITPERIKKFNEKVAKEIFGKITLSINENFKLD